MYKYLKSSIYTLCILIGCAIIMTILNYFNILMGNVLKITELLIPIISIFIGSYILGKSSNNKGYIEGLKYGMAWIILFLIINLISKNLEKTTIEEEIANLKKEVIKLREDTLNNKKLDE